MTGGETATHEKKSYVNAQVVEQCSCFTATVWCSFVSRCPERSEQIQESPDSASEAAYRTRHGLPAFCFVSVFITR